MRKSPQRSRSASAGKPINLALQGGGSHGALTWGVLDRLLEDDRLAIRDISGTSAGAMNAVVLADGYARGGRDGAREALAAFWRAVSNAAAFSPIARSSPFRRTVNCPAAGCADVTWIFVPGTSPSS